MLYLVLDCGERKSAAVRTHSWVRRRDTGMNAPTRLWVRSRTGRSCWRAWRGRMRIHVPYREAQRIKPLSTTTSWQGGAAGGGRAAPQARALGKKTSRALARFGLSLSACPTRASAARNGACAARLTRAFTKSDRLSSFSGLKTVSLFVVPTSPDPVARLA
jgi:hypothetical protein